MSSFDIETLKDTHPTFLSIYIYIYIYLQRPGDTVEGICQNLGLFNQLGACVGSLCGFLLVVVSSVYVDYDDSCSPPLMNHTDIEADASHTSQLHLPDYSKTYH